ncbi:MAG: CinA family protein [Acidimicrobiales bacterium]
MGDEEANIGSTLQRRGLSLAVAESLTGGMLASRFAQAPSASEWFEGALVAYSRDTKHHVLQVPPGPVVSEKAVLAMVDGVARLLKSDVALAVTGVGGPDSQDGQAPGTVWVATWPPDLGPAILLRLEGQPAEVCEQACARATSILGDRLRA